MSTIIDLHIMRSKVNVNIPYDKLYLFKREHRDLIPRIFSYALVLPLAEEMVAEIKKQPIAHVSHRHFRRNDDDLKQPVNVPEGQLAQWWGEFMEIHEFSQRVAVVPILVAKSRKHVRPRYLTSARTLPKNRNRRQLQLADAPIHEMAYLSTPHPAPNDKIRPICTICPRMLLQMQGKCNPGQKICYETLDFSEIVPAKSEAETIADASVQSEQPEDNRHT